MLLDEDFIYNWSENSWGDRLVIMEKNGWAMVVFYYYYDDKSATYVSDLCVEKAHRKQGWATKLLSICEDMARAASYQKVVLFVEKDTWMHKWYIRLGYHFMKDKEEGDDKEEIWMEKIL